MAGASAGNLDAGGCPPLLSPEARRAAQPSHADRAGRSVLAAARRPRAGRLGGRVFLSGALSGSRTLAGGRRFRRAPRPGGRRAANSLGGIVLDTLRAPTLAPHPDTAGLSRVLAVVAHPDDVEWGAAGTVARWVLEGKDVAYLLASRGEAGLNDPQYTRADVARLREAEERAAAVAVGVKAVEFLEHPDGNIAYSLDLRRDIARAIRRHRPEVVLTQNPEITWGAGGGLNQADHRAVGLATIDAILDASIRLSFPELLAEGLEPWGGVKRVYVSGMAGADEIVDTTETIDLAVAALQAHAVYVAAFPGFDPEKMLRERGAQIGREKGYTYGERFRVFRRG
ncbi:MAG: PIG-L family deacetylase [Chloroflexi bacterium]|nr:PIG-L family deacetylase [Chloroflexota bacterium]